MSLLGAIFTAAVCWVLGRLLFQALGIRLKRTEHDLLAGLTGASLLSLAVFLLCVVKLARTPIFLVLGLLFVIVFFVRRERKPAAAFPPLEWFWKWLFGAAFALYAVVYLANSLAPEHSPDGMTYHLGLVANYFRDHGFVRVTTNMFANLSQGTEMLFLFAFAFGRHSAAATVHCLFLFTLPLLMLSYARRIGHPAAGVFAAMMVYLSPLAGIDGVSAYNDVALATAAFAMFYFLEIWRDLKDDRLLVPIGLLAGFCFAIKFTGVMAFLYAVVMVIACNRAGLTARIRRLTILSADSAVLALPWLIKNWIWLGNPFSPFFNRLFPNPYFHASAEDVLAQNMRTYLLPSLKPIFWIVTVSGRLGGQIGPLFLLAPLALLSVRSRVGRACVLAALVFLLPYPLNIGARFLIPVLPFAALGIAMAVESLGSASKPIYALLVVAAAVLAWPRVIDKYSAAAGSWQIVHVPWKAALHIIPPEQFLDQNSPDYRLARALGDLVPANRRVWSTMPVAQAWTSTAILVNDFSAEGEVIEDMVQIPLIPSYQPLYIFRFTFPRRSLNRIRVAQNAEYAGDVFSITELRFYRGNEEIKPAHAEASPFPWDIGFSFDGNPVTRWRSWESLRPGMHVDVDFGAPTALDRVDLCGSWDELHADFRLEGANLEKDAKLEKIVLQPGEDLRRRATRTINARGIDYLLIGNDYVAAADIHADPQRWGLKSILDRDGARLYEIQ